MPRTSSCPYPCGCTTDCELRFIDPEAARLAEAEELERAARPIIRRESERLQRETLAERGRRLTRVAALVDRARESMRLACYDDGKDVHDVRTIAERAMGDILKALQ